MQTEVTTTTANISWTVPSVEYCPENYTVVYHGLELQTESRMSEWIVSDPTNIPVTNQMYFVVLGGLEEANTYNYTVQSTSCKGTTTSDMLQFTTLPDSELANLHSCSTVLHTIQLRNKSFMCIY